MKILFAFFVFLILFTGLEIYTISLLAGYIGIWDALAIILLTGLIGAFIARKKAKGAWRNLVKGDSSSGPPARQIFDAVAFFFAAVLLILPGLITDIFGILILFPFIRNLFYKEVSKGKIGRKAPGAFQDAGFKSPHKKETTLDSDGVIDIEAEDV